MTPVRWPSWPAWLAVAIGGTAGTELRYSLGLLFPEQAGAIPWTTLGINVTGSFVLALLTTIWMARPHTSFWLRAGLGPGLLGSFTTFSAVVYSLDSLAIDGLYLPMTGYLALSLLLGLGAAAAGWRAGRSIPLRALSQDRDPR